MIFSPYDGVEFICGDANLDGEVNIPDAIFALNHLFLGTDTLPGSYPQAGPDPTVDALGCLGF